MTTYLIVTLVLFLIGAGVNLGRVNDAPFLTISIFIDGAMATWALYLLMKGLS